MANIFVTRMLTRGLFAVANLLVYISCVCRLALFAELAYSFYITWCLFAWL